VIIDVDTLHGLARAHLRLVDRPRAALVLGHGAGGGIGAPDLVAASDAAARVGVSVALVEQPYRVAGRRAPAPAGQLDVAWTTVVRQLAGAQLRSLPLVVGGRSLGARVACRTAAELGATGVLCLAVPVHPPGRPEKSRLAELDAVGVQTLVVQGERDPFGIPPPGPRRQVVLVPGDHSLKRGLEAVGDAVQDWLSALLG
jgi:predicted alpha/beta-hydrolase family hydrolase